MYSPLAENHATLGWSADGRLPLQPWDRFNILHLSVLCTQGGGAGVCEKKSIFFFFVLPLLSCSAPLVPTDTSQK